MSSSARKTYKPVVGDVYVSVTATIPDMFVVMKLGKACGFFYLWLMDGELLYSPCDAILGWKRL